MHSYQQAGISILNMKKFSHTLYGGLVEENSNFHKASSIYNDIQAPYSCKPINHLVRCHHNDTWDVHYSSTQKKS